MPISRSVMARRGERMIVIDKIHTCLVCGYSGDQEFEARDYQICGCCGTEFGYDDRSLTHEQLRDEWISKGFPWFDPEQAIPIDWDPVNQLGSAGFVP